MISTRAPFRITLGGGGTDLPSFYENYGGFLVTMAIDKYIYVMVNRMIVDPGIQLHYRTSEYVEDPKDLKHPFARAILQRLGIKRHIELTSLAELPARSGLGSSGSYAVATILALRTYLRKSATTQQIAEEACDIEINVLKNQVGKQDQYVAAFGGIISLDIDRSGVVTVERFEMASSDIADFLNNMRVYYTGVHREASKILSIQDDATKQPTAANHQKIVDSLKHIKELGYKTREHLLRKNFDAYGEMLDSHWMSKKKLSGGISNEKIDGIYASAKSEYGVLGGKLIGAGGGGFLLLYAPSKQRELDSFMFRNGMPRLHYFVDSTGAKVIADVMNYQDNLELSNPIP